uniref:NADH-ubiquinone oxidoreductase chain 4 n=1 Tax=Ramulus mikado TaxID=2823491 RepID=E2RUV2_9NEOP|nr:NADH dehydrogenase subunit 4 [Ramulus irregulariterdentatus]BAJ24486.1 NADH dehydrogenase subunit 4 [Ramulus irregulariterdentatus]
MLKFLIFTLFLMPFSYYGFWWLVLISLMMMNFIFYFFFNGSYYFFSMSYFMGVDVISYMLILLSIWICSLMLLASSSIYHYEYYYKMFIFFILLLLFVLFLCFSSNNLIMFYLFFESSLIPTIFLIFGWGYQPERLQAGIYFLFYTLFSSLPMLISILYFYNIYGSLSFSLTFNYNYFYFLFYVCMIFAFLVKIPMFFVHLWLPKAHVEAPVSGSMILAGVLLKLGGYGLFRVFSFLLLSGVSYNFVWISIGLMGGLIISLICLRQSDLKSLIAYSSVIHMSLVLGGLMTMNYWGFYGSIIMMVAHGLCSSGLFCLANIVYERLGSRSLLIISGLINFMPSMSLWWFLLSSYNMAAPPSLNLMGEIMLFNSIISWNSFNTYIFMIMSFFSATYTLYMYSYTQHGNLSSISYSFVNGYLYEYLLLFLHWIPLNLIIFTSSYMFI